MDVDEAVVCTYELDGEFPLEDAARVVAMEQSTGTWTELEKREGSLEEELAAEVVATDKGTKTAKVAFHMDIFEPENIPGFLAITAGNLFGLGSLSRCRWVDLDLPESFVAAHPGPSVGIEGLRQLRGTTESGRPHCGTIIKPKVGLRPKQTAEVAKESALGGLDLIKDDETLTDQAFCPLDERARRVLDALDEAAEKTGEPKTLYAVNITAPASQIVSRWERVAAYGANCVMVDVLTSGFDAIRELRLAGCDLPIHVHRAMHGAFTRSPDYGIDMRVLCRLTRLVGGDQFHIGSASGKMEHPERMDALLDACRDDWHGLKPMLPVSSGGLHPHSVWSEAEAYGLDFVCQAGGGVHGHPDGTTAGARAMRQAVEAVGKGQSREAAAGEHEELRKAIDKWQDETYDYDT